MSKNEAGIEHKDKGNAAFKAGDFPAAVGHYTAAALADPSNPTFLLNRAAAYLKLGKNEDAERDSSNALNLDAKSSKAWFRRARARIALGKLSEAQADLNSLLRIEPSSQEAKQELKGVQEALIKSNIRRSSNTPISVIPVATSSGSSPPKRRRVPITVIDSEPPLAITPPLTPSTLSISKSQAATFLAPPSSAITTSPQQSNSSSGIPSTHTRGGIFRSNGKHTIFDVKEREELHDLRTSTPSATSSSDVPKLNSLPNILVVPQVPQNVTDSIFQKTWQLLPTAEQRWRYLRQVPPSKLPLLFKKSLEPSTIDSILRTFRDVLGDSETSAETKVAILEYMTALPLAARWKTVLLLLSGRERQVVEDVWGLLSDCDATKETLEAWGIS